MPMDPYDLRRNDLYLCNAWHLALASKLAYEDVPGEIRSALGARFPNVRHLSSGPARGFVAGNDAHVMVALRGTDDLRDWIDNLQYTQVRGYGGKAHKGFADQMAGLWPQLLAAVRSLRRQRQAVWVTGHSLGGALAILAAKKLAASRIRAQMVCTFAAPRVFNPQAAAAFRLPAHRFVNGEDVAPHLPMRGIVNRYDDVGDITYFLNSGRISAQGTGFQRMARRLARMMIYGVGSLGAEIFKDHEIGEYIRKIHINLPASRR